MSLFCALFLVNGISIIALLSFLFVCLFVCSFFTEKKAYFVFHSLSLA